MSDQDRITRVPQCLSFLFLCMSDAVQSSGTYYYLFLFSTWILNFKVQEPTLDKKSPKLSASWRLMKREAPSAKHDYLVKSQTRKENVITLQPGSYYLSSFGIEPRTCIRGILGVHSMTSSVPTPLHKIRQKQEKVLFFISHSQIYLIIFHPQLQRSSLTWLIINKTKKSIDVVKTTYSCKNYWFQLATSRGFDLLRKR